MSAAFAGRWRALLGFSPTSPMLANFTDDLNIIIAVSVYVIPDCVDVLHQTAPRKHPKMVTLRCRSTLDGDVLVPLGIVWDRG